MLNVIITSYVPEGGGPDHPRAKYLYRTLDSLAAYLDSPFQDELGFSDEALRFVIANDGPANQPHIERSIMRSIDMNIDLVIAAGDRAGIGGSLNRAIRQCVERDDLWLYTTDDWLLTQSYDLAQAVRLIRELKYQYVRLGPPHPNISCETKFMAGLGWWLKLDPRFGGFAFATRPFIATRTFWEYVGPFAENCDAYVCERNYADRVADAPGVWNAMAEVINGSLEGPWEHIGDEEVGDKFP